MTQGMFPLTLVGPGQNPNQPPQTPQTQPGHPSNTGITSTSNPRKRKRTTPPIKTALVGGFGPLSPGETATETGSPTPPPPSSTSGGRRNGAADVWAFARPLNSAEEPPVDEWPTPSGSIPMTKPGTEWFGCKLCSESGCAMCLSVCGVFTLTSFRYDHSNDSGPKVWKTFQNKKGSSPTTSFRRHLEDHHKSTWRRECMRLGIPTKQQAKTPNAPEYEQFTKEGLLKCLIKFVTSDDQVRSMHYSVVGGSR